MSDKRPICNTCGKSCTNVRKGWGCATNDKLASPEFLKLRRAKRTVEVKRGWIHVHGGLPYSRLFTTKALCLADIEWKAGNNPLSRARRATITTITEW